MTENDKNSKVNQNEFEPSSSEDGLIYSEVFKNDENSMSSESSTQKVEKQIRPKDSAWATIALILGISSLIFSWVPIFGIITLIISVPGLIISMITFISARHHPKTKSSSIPVAASIVNIISLLVVFLVNGGIAYLGYKTVMKLPVHYDKNSGEIVLEDSLSNQAKLERIHGLSIENIGFDIVEPTAEELEFDTNNIPVSKILSWKMTFSHTDSSVNKVDVKVGFYDSTGVLIHEDDFRKINLIAKKNNVMQKRVLIEQEKAKLIKDISYRIERSIENKLNEVK